MSEDLGSGYSSGENNGGYTTPGRKRSPEVKQLKNEVEALRRQVQEAEERQHKLDKQAELDKQEAAALRREKSELEARLKKSGGRK